MGFPGHRVEPDEVVAAVGGRTQDEAAGRRSCLEARERLLEVGGRDGRAVAVDDDDELGAVGEEIDEDAGKARAERVAALREATPASGAAGERIGRRVADRPAWLPSSRASASTRLVPSRSSA